VANLFALLFEDNQDWLRWRNVVSRMLFNFVIRRTQIPNFRPTSVQFKGRINSDAARKRHRTWHLEFYTPRLLTEGLHLVLIWEVGRTISLSNIANVVSNCCCSIGRKNHSRAFVYVAHSGATRRKGFLTSSPRDFSESNCVFGTYRASATRNYSAAISSEDPATIRIYKSRAATSRCRDPKTQSDAIDGFPQADFLEAIRSR